MKSGFDHRYFKGNRAVKEHGWRRVQVVAPERPGIHGGFQQWWWGVGVICLRDAVIVSFDGQVLESNMPTLDVPGYGLGSFLGNYASMR